jgi:tRNA-5-methyluridine54 2-sulfurtransferase
MNCERCEKTAIIELQHGSLCKDHFLNYFEKKVFKTINKYKLVSRDDVVCVAASGGKDSLTVLYLLKKYFEKNNFDIKNLSALSIDEGIKGYRNVTLQHLQDFCTKHNVPLEVQSFKDNFTITLDDAIPIIQKKTGKKPCNICGAWRRYLLNTFAKKMGATKVVTGHNLDDEAQAVLMNTFKANNKQSSKMGPISGLKTHAGFVQRVKPLYFCTEKETRLYTFIKQIKVDNAECPNVTQSYRADIRDMLNSFEAKYPGTKTGIINSFLYTLPLLKEHHTNSNNMETSPKKCEVCSEPSQKTICNACELVALI